MGFILSILAYILFFIVAIINFPIVMIKYAKKESFIKTMNKYWFYNARDLDIYGNYTYRTTWNTLCRTKYGYEFGFKGETISSALGRNQLYNTLTWFGWFLVYVLWLIDVKYWFKGGHCLNSIQNF